MKGSTGPKKQGTGTFYGFRSKFPTATPIILGRRVGESTSHALRELLPPVATHAT